MVADWDDDERNCKVFLKYEPLTEPEGLGNMFKDVNKNLQRKEYYNELDYVVYEFEPLYIPPLPAQAQAPTPAKGHEDAPKNEELLDVYGAGLYS